MEDLQIIRQQAAQAAAELTEKAGLKAGDIFVVGCSSSEIIGGEIGHASSLEAAQAAYEGIQSVLAPKGVFLAAQCCEHLNRAIVLPAAAVKPWQQPVNVIPQPKAGGSFATTAWNRLETRRYWRASRPTPAWTSGAPSSACICGRWRCRCAFLWTTSAAPFCSAPAPGPNSSAVKGPITTTA